MPDDELLNLAKNGKLRENLDAQVKRMLASPKAAALTENFAGQWLRIPPAADGPAGQGPCFRTTTRRWPPRMQKETELFF